MRTTELKRNTNETKIELKLDIDGKGQCWIDTKCGFLDHMLTLFAKHGRFDINLVCDGDVYVDYHHTTEDIAIALGEAFKICLGDKKGITRYGNIILPMDEALVLSAVDISGRGGLYFDMNILTEKVGDFDTELCEEFWKSFANNAGITLHINQLAGKNSHHIIEASFKSVARSLKMAVVIDPEYIDEIPSTKGLL